MRGENKSIIDESLQTLSWNSTVFHFDVYLWRCPGPASGALQLREGRANRTEHHKFNSILGAMGGSEKVQTENIWFNFSNDEHKLGVPEDCENSPLGATSVEKIK